MSKCEHGLTSRECFVCASPKHGAAPAQPAEPVAFADKIAFESAMKAGKGCDVWPTAGDYTQRTGRDLVALTYAQTAQQMKLLGDLVALHDSTPQAKKDEFGTKWIGRLREHETKMRAAWIAARDALAAPPQPALTERVAELEAALRGMLALDEEHHQRGYDDDDVCAEVQFARAVLAAAQEKKS